MTRFFLHKKDLRSNGVRKYNFRLSEYFREKYILQKAFPSKLKNSISVITLDASRLNLLVQRYEKNTSLGYLNEMCYKVNIVSIYTTIKTENLHN